MARNPLYPFGAGGFGRVSGDPFMSLHREMNRLFDDAFRGMTPPGQGLGAQPGLGGQPGQGGPAAPGGQDVAQAGLGQGGFAQVALVPHMDVSETDTELRIAAELPGVAEGDVEVMLHDDVLTIRGEKKFERADERENYHFVERSYGTFQRSLRIPWPVNPDEVQADFERGVLTVTLPKAKQEEKSRRIEVRSGGSGGGDRTIGGTASEQGRSGPSGTRAAGTGGHRGGKSTSGS
jgi:HSP20 family protein